MKVMYSAAEGKAWKEECGVRKQIQVRDARPPLVVISRSHSDNELKEYLQQLGEHQTTSIGSSLKFCLVAEGHAQLYPRLGQPTSGIRPQAMRWPPQPVRMFMTGRVSRLTTPRASRF
jgi:3'-phosphoadenosine 5'-phosphosulfate (PAPS) 3'-phosphatase